FFSCPKCGCDDASMLEQVAAGRWFCNNCSHDWDRSPERLALPRGALRSASLSGERPRFISLDDLVARTGLRRRELVTLADLGALNAFGYDRRSALWQAERAVRPTGELFSTTLNAEHAERADVVFEEEDSASSASSAFDVCPLKPMNEAERLVADYAGTGLTTG